MSHFLPPPRIKPCVIGYTKLELGIIMHSIATFHGVTVRKEVRLIQLKVLAHE
jgi:hypothetical protein